MAKIRYEELLTSDFKKIRNRKPIIFLPLGTLEWHSDHLPLGMDAMAAHEICQRLAKKIGGMVIPPLYFGTDRAHRVKGKIFYGMDRRAGYHLPGSIYYLKPNLLYRLLLNIFSQIERQDFKLLVVITGHYGRKQIEILEKAAKNYKGKIKIYAANMRQLFKKTLSQDQTGHAGTGETSLFLALRPELVHMEKLKKDLSKPIEILRDDPRGRASKKLGKKILKSIMNKVSTDILKITKKFPCST